MAYLVHVSCLSTTTVSQLFEPQLQKIVILRTQAFIFLFALGRPLRESRKTLHKWKDNSALAKPLAACTHLSSTVSQLFEPQVQTRSSAIADKPRGAGLQSCWGMAGLFSEYVDKKFTYICYRRFGTEKLEWCRYPTVKKISKISVFVLTWSTNVTDGHTDRHCVTA